MPQLSFNDALNYLARILPQVSISKGVKKKLVCIPYFVCILPSRGTVEHFTAMFRVSAQSQLLPISSVSATSHSALWQAAYSWSKVARLILAQGCSVRDFWGSPMVLLALPQ